MTHPEITESAPTRMKFLPPPQVIEVAGLQDGRQTAIGIESLSVDGENKKFLWVENLPIEIDGKERGRLAQLIAKYKCVGIDVAIGKSQFNMRAFPRKRKALEGNPSEVGIYADASIPFLKITREINGMKLPKWDELKAKDPRCIDFANNALKYLPKDISAPTLKSIQASTPDIISS